MNFVWMGWTLPTALFFAFIALALLTLGVLARRVALSERHFLRRFTAELGTTPARYVADVRVDAARRELEDGTDSVAAIAARVGFGTAESMRRTFVRDLGAPPDDYRRRFTHRKDHAS